jgi:hypothetical protein
LGNVTPFQLQYHDEFYPSQDHVRVVAGCAYTQQHNYTFLVVAEVALRAQTMPHAQTLLAVMLLAVMLVVATHWFVCVILLVEMRAEVILVVYDEVVFADFLRVHPSILLRY